MLFDLAGSMAVRLFSYSHLLWEVDAERRLNRCYLLLLVASDLVICYKQARLSSKGSLGDQENYLQTAALSTTTDFSNYLWSLDSRVHLNSIEFLQGRCSFGDTIEFGFKPTPRKFVSSSVLPIRTLTERCLAQKQRVPDDAPHLAQSTRVPQNVHGEDVSTSQEINKHPGDLRQLVVDAEDETISGTVAEFVQKMLLETPSKSVQFETDSLIQSVGLWISAEALLGELCETLAAPSREVPKSRPGQIVSILLEHATSLLLESKTVEALLKLIESTEVDEMEGLRSNLWSRRTQLLNIISQGPSCQGGSPNAESEDCWAAEYQSLSRSGLQSESVLAIPADLFATQLHIFHQYYLKHWNPARDKSLFFSSSHRGASRNPLIFSHHKMHFLTATILSHILCIDSRPASSRKRAAICTQWILIGIVSKRLGDMTGWLATVMAICAPSVIRLKEMWTLVEDRLRAIVEKEWSPVMRDLFRRSVATERVHEISAHVLAPDAAGRQAPISDIVPYYGDLCDAVEVLRQEVVSNSNGKKVVHLNAVVAARSVLSTALESYETFLIDSDAGSVEDETESPSVVLAFQDCFKQLNSMPCEVLQIYSPAFLLASSKCECLRPDDLSTRKESSASGFGTCAFMPLLFTDQLPCYRLFNALDLLDINEIHKRPKLQSTSTGIRSTPASLGGTPMRRLNSFPPTQRPARYTTGHGHLDDSTRARTAASISQWKMLRHVRDLTGVSDQVLTFSSGNLILKDSEEDHSTTNRRRPQSVLMEARKRDSAVSRRSSLNLVDMPPAEIDDDLVIKPSKCSTYKKGTRKFAIKAGTFDVLVDLLILDINDIVGANSVAQAYDKRLAFQSIEVDRPEFIQVFLASHRSYCNSSVLLDSLSTRLKMAFSASTVNFNEDEATFPDWSGSTLHEGCEIDWLRVEKITTGISEVVSTWLNIAPGNFTESPSMSDSLDNFLRTARCLLSDQRIASTEEPAAHACTDLYASQLRRIHKQVLRVRHRPQSWSLLLKSEESPTAHEPFSIERLSTLLDTCDAMKSLDCIVNCVLQATSIEDWMICYELLELKALDPRGFSKCITELVDLDTDVEIHDSLWLLENTTIDHSTDTLLKSMPLAIRSLVQLRFSITSWTVAQMTDPTLNLETRVKRAQLFLKMLEISGKYMSSFDIQIEKVPGKTRETQIVPSFIAGAIASGLVSPQSRLFSLCWTTVAQIAGKEDSLASLINLVPSDAEVPEPHVPIVPCPAWLIDRMLEIACYIPDKLVDNPRLINLDKRRYIYNLLTNLDLTGSGSPGSRICIENYANNPFLFLLAPSKRSPDWKMLRSTAFKENQSFRNMRLQRPFYHLVQQEHEKARRDIRFRDNIEKQLRDLQKMALRKQQETSRNFEASKRPATRSRYGMNSLLKAVRPISVAITSNWAPEKQSGLPRVVSPSDLPTHCSIPRSTKPALTIDLVNSVSSILDMQENLFRIKTEDGLETTFQATSVDDMNDWVRHLSLASTDGAKKRRTMIREDARLAAIEDTPQFSPRNSMVVHGDTAIFGISLADLVRREGTSIPKIATVLINEIEKRGLQETGIYRISGSLSTVNALKKAFDSGSTVNLSEHIGDDINAITSVFKLWLRELPEPLMTYALYDAFLETLEIEDYTAKSLSLKELVHRLPVPNFSMLKKLIEHLEKITDYETTNHMYAHNLAIVFGPNVLQPVPSAMSLACSMNDLGKVQTLIRNLILQCHWIFSVDEEVGEREVKIVRAVSDGRLSATREYAS